MRFFNPMGDDVASLSLFLTWTPAAQGKTFRVVVPLQNLTLDARPGQQAQFACFLDYKIFAPLDENARPMVFATLLPHDLAPAGGPMGAQNPLDATREVRYTMQLSIRFDALAAPPATPVLMAVFGKLRATGVEAPQNWPLVTPTPSAPLSLSGAEGAVAAAVIEEW